MRLRAVCILACVLLAACGGGDRAASSGDAAMAAVAPGRRILRVAYEREIDVLNPFTSQNLVDISFSMIEGLVTTDEHNQFVPVLAEEIPTEQNGLIRHNRDGTVDMTWRLRENVRWHDSVAFTSRDVCFTWKFVTSENSETYNRDEYLGIIGCSTPDEHTAVFHWNGEYGYYAGLFEAILPEHVLGGMTTQQIVNYTPYNRGPATIGTGPFRFAEWKAGEYIRVVRNPDYWRGPQYPAIDEIVWAFIPDANTRLNAMRAGQYHFARILPLQVDAVTKLAGYQTHLISSNTFLHFDINVQTPHGRALFADVNVRKALFHAIDRRAIAAQLMQGRVTIADTPINPDSPWHDAGVPHYDYDPALARRMLDAAGWRAGPDGVRVKAGARFAFVMLNRAGTADRIAVAQVIQAQLRDIGVAVTFETLESAAWTQRWRSGRWEAMVSAWFLAADPSLTSIYACNGPNNMTGLCDAPSGQPAGRLRSQPFLREAQAAAGCSAGASGRSRRVAAALLQRQSGSREHPRGQLSRQRHQLRQLLEPLAMDAAVSGVWLRRRLLQMIPLLFGITIVLFTVIQLAPGGPEGALLESGRFMDPSVIESYRHRLGVDRPVPVQYVRWLGALLHGDLGISFASTRPVSRMILERLPATLELMGSAFLLAALAAVALGIFSAVRQYSLLDYVTTGLSFAGIAMPVFWFALILQLVFAVRLGWLPVSGTKTIGDASLSDHLAHLVLPALVLSTRYIAGWSRYLRSTLLRELRADYVRTARAKGLPERAVIGRHALRNALIPLVSIMALNLADLFSGAVLVETIFAWPGIGRMFVQAMFGRDYPLLMGILLLGSVMVVVFNLLADAMYGVLDPRIRYE